MKKSHGGHHVCVCVCVCVLLKCFHLNGPTDDDGYYASLACFSEKVSCRASFVCSTCVLHLRSPMQIMMTVLQWHVTVKKSYADYDGCVLLVSFS